MSGIRIIFALLFFGMLGSGIYLFRNFERLFGANPDLPSENASARTYAKVAIVLVWLHALFLTAAFAFFGH